MSILNKEHLKTLFHKTFARKTSEVYMRVGSGPGFFKEVVLKLFNPLVFPVLRWTRVIESEDKLDFYNVDFIQFSINVNTRDPIDISLDENNILLLDDNTAFVLGDGSFLSVGE